MKSYTHKLRKFCENKDGEITLFQSPNIPLSGWLLCEVLGYFLHPSAFKTGVMMVGSSLLFTWAFLEVTHGDSAFRRVLGAIILTALCISFFR